MDLVDIYAFLKPNRGVIAGSTIVAVTLALVYAFTATPPSPPTAPTGVALDDARKPLGRPVKLQKMPCARTVVGCDHLAPAIPQGTSPSGASLGPPDGGDNEPYRPSEQLPGTPNMASVTPSDGLRRSAGVRRPAFSSYGSAAPNPASQTPSDGLRNSAGVPRPAFSFNGANTASLTPNDGLRGAANLPEGGDKAKALTALQYAADQGHLAAQWKVGRMYAVGDGVPQDAQRAFVYFSQIANTHPDEPPGTAQARIVANAFVALGHYYLDGIPNSSVVPDAARAREMFAYAASYFGDADAQYQLGRLYLDGTPSDPQQAVRWFQLAATKGDCRAEAVLGDMLFQGHHVPRQAARGLMWLTLGRDCAGAEEAWLKPLYDNAFHRASDDERAMALVFLEGWLKGRRD
jgi:hypothetical protein